MKDESQINLRLAQIANEIKSLEQSLNPLDGAIVHRNARLLILKLEVEQKALLWVLNQ